MKKFKHKTRLFTAERVRDGIYRIIRREESGFGVYDVPNTIIEWCSDREEVVEKDWINICLARIRKMWWWFWIPWAENEIRKILEQYAPKEKKFTDTDISKFAKEKAIDFDQEILVRGTLELFLKEHWLYLIEE